MELLVANSSQLVVAGATTMPVEIDDQTLTSKMMIIKDLVQPLIIGVEFFKVFKGVLHFKKGEVSFNKNENFSIPATAKLTIRDNQKVDESIIYLLEPSIH